jgi:hypothetical protein
MTAGPRDATVGLTGGVWLVRSWNDEGRGRHFRLLAVVRHCVGIAGNQGNTS